MKRNIILKPLAGAFLSLVVCCTAHAAVAPGAASQNHGAAVNAHSSSAASASETRWTSRLSELSPSAATLLSMLYGPQLGKGDHTPGVSVQNQLGVRWDLTDSISLSPVFDFVYQMTDPDGYEPSNRLSLDYDSFLKLYAADLASLQSRDASLSVDGELRFFVPTSQSSRDNGTIGSVRAAFYSALNLNHSDFSVGLAGNLRYWLQTRETSVYDKTIDLPRVNFYMAPQLNYRFDTKISGWLLYETYFSVDTRGAPNLDDTTLAHADLEPGVDLRITPSITISPYLNWYLNQKITTTSVNLTASIAI